MSVREQLFVRTERPPGEVAHMIAESIGGRTEVRAGESWVLVDTGRLAPGAAGEFGGPVVAHVSEGPFRPEGEFEAADAYTVEIRLWQAQGPRVDPATGADVEAVAAAAVFEAVAQLAEWPALHVRGDDKLVRAALPGKGTHDFPPGTTIYDWDAEKWGGWVLPPS